MVVVTVLLAKGVPECTTVGVNVGSRTIESRVLTPTCSPVWGEDVSLTQELDGQRVAHMVFSLLRNSERVGQAALTLDTTQAFGHRALPVEPHGTLMVSWASEPVSLENKPVPSATSPSAAAGPPAGTASPNRIPGAGAVPPPYPHAAESTGVVFGRHPGLQPPVQQYQPPQLEAAAATPAAAAAETQQAPPSGAREKSPYRETERTREQEWEKERDRLTPGGIPVDANRHTAFSVLREEKLDRDTVSIKSQLLHQLLEEMKAMQEKMSQMSEQQDRLEVRQQKPLNSHASTRSTPPTHTHTHSAQLPLSRSRQETASE